LQLGEINGAAGEYVVNDCAKLRTSVSARWVFGECEIVAQQVATGRL